jgi:CRP/FNR family transcriptional regulator, nitrogen fixation regulation protein
MQMETMARTATPRLGLCDRMGSSPAMERLGTLLRCEVDETVYHCEDEAQYWYRLVTGAARKCALSADGRRQIVDFLLPGDLFGFGTHSTHHFSAEVIIRGTIVARYPRQGVERLAESDPRVARWIRESAFESISRLQTRMLILGRASALARVSAFLLEWTGRCSPTPHSAVTLPMSRYDIADYLAMAVETVSRALTVLRERQVIALHGTRRLSICDRQALESVMEGLDSAGTELETFGRCSRYGPDLVLASRTPVR